MENTVDLFAEMRGDLKRIDGTLLKINGHFEFWLPKWEQQTHGMMSLENELASVKNQFEKLKDHTNSEISLLRSEIAAKETAEQKLEAIAEQARKERRDTFRWVVVTAFSAIGVTIALVVFLMQHVSLK